MKTGRGTGKSKATKPIKKARKKRTVKKNVAGMTREEYKKHRRLNRPIMIVLAGSDEEFLGWQKGHEDYYNGVNAKTVNDIRGYTGCGIIRLPNWYRSPIAFAPEIVICSERMEPSDRIRALAELRDGNLPGAPRFGVLQGRSPLQQEQGQ